MTKAKSVLTDSEFAKLYEELGVAELTRRLGIDRRNVQRRRAKIEGKSGNLLVSSRLITQNKPYGALPPDRINYPDWLQVRITDGVILVGSDAHFWPGQVSTAWRGFLHLARVLAPRAVILNGDVIDGSTVSRWPPLNWEKLPDLVQEIEYAAENLAELAGIVPDAELIWSLGNHDARYERRLAQVAPEYAKLKGVHLKDHFGERWQPCWSCAINDDIVAMHRFRGGIHAAHNNVLWGGRTLITADTHSLKVWPLTDFNGTRFGVDTGMLAEPYMPQFQYMEGKPRNWRSGFIVLTFVNGELLWPEIAFAPRAGELVFRGEVIHL